MSSLDRLTWKTPRFEHRVISCYTAKLYLFEGLPAPPHAPREQPISAMGGGTPTIFGITWPIHSLTLVFRFPDFPYIREWRHSNCLLQISNSACWRKLFLGAHMYTPIGHNQFQNIYWVVWQSFAKVGSGTSKNLWTEKKTKLHSMRWFSYRHRSGGGPHPRGQLLNAMPHFFVFCP